MCTLLVDTDALLYRYGLMNPVRDTVDFHDLGSPVINELTDAERFKMSTAAIEEKINLMMADTGASHFWLCMANPGKCFRYTLFPTYKGHRKPAPPIISILREWIQQKYAKHLWCASDVETDDIIADLHVPTGETVAVSNDKDFLQLPGWNLHPFTGNLEWITPRQGYLFLLYQVLVGDSADGYPGCPGIGDVKARDILLAAMEVPNVSLEAVVLLTYLTQGSSADDFMLNLQLAALGTPSPKRTFMMPELPLSYLKVLEAIQS